ncbi:hypothetical protein KC726_01645 [Candidatus Woesebacteria bacterium]|nr:hypothetical protein [Candidatus Woesebacteria bacterium]
MSEDISRTRYASLQVAMATAFAANPPYIRLLTARQIPGNNEPGLQHHKQKAVRGLIINQGSGSNELPKALFSEWATFIALQRLISPFGYDVHLAPDTFEKGLTNEKFQRKGVDLILAKIYPQIGLVPFLGINVKLASIKPNRIHERHVYDPLLFCPSLNLSLGDWQVAAWENDMHIREWLHHLALPKIGSTGKIPYFDSLRQYIIERIFETLEAYYYKLYFYTTGEWEPGDHEQSLFPDAPNELPILRLKLEEMYDLFQKLK